MVELHSLLRKATPPRVPIPSGRTRPPHRETPRDRVQRPPWDNWAASACRLSKVLPRRPPRPRPDLGTSIKESAPAELLPKMKSAKFTPSRRRSTFIERTPSGEKSPAWNTSASSGPSPLPGTHPGLEFVWSGCPDQAKIQAARCMDCGTPFCQRLPLNNIVPDPNDLRITPTGRTPSPRYQHQQLPRSSRAASAPPPAKRPA